MIRDRGASSDGERIRFNSAILKDQTARLNAMEMRSAVP
jgi:hypothetical protein